MTTPLATTLYALPEGYTARAMTLDDAEAVAEFYNATARQAGDEFITSADALRDDWDDPKFNLADSSRIVFDAEGNIAGVIVVWAISDVPVTPFVNWDVLHSFPEAHLIGLHLLEWGENRAREVIDRCPPDARVAMKSGTKKGYTPDEAILEAYGMTPARFFNRMLINMTEAPTIPSLPAGYTLTTHAERKNLRELVVARDEAWRDHFGYVETPIDGILEEWQHWIDKDKHNLYDMWYLAIDDATNEIASIVLCRNEEWDDPKVGYVNIVATRRAYRKQGLAETLLRIALAEFWKRGRKDVSLHVDGDSPTGATRLYTRAGMHVNRTFTQYQKELRPGVQLWNTGSTE